MIAARGAPLLSRRKILVGEWWLGRTLDANKRLIGSRMAAVQPLVSSSNATKNRALFFASIAFSSRSIGGGSLSSRRQEPHQTLNEAVLRSPSLP
jgi:hypothetical protein